MWRFQSERRIVWAFAGMAVGVAACTGSSDSITVEGNVAVAYVKRPVSALGNPKIVQAGHTGQRIHRENKDVNELRLVISDLVVIAGLEMPA